MYVHAKIKTTPKKERKRERERDNEWMNEWERKEEKLHIINYLQRTTVSRSISYYCKRVAHLKYFGAAFALYIYCIQFNRNRLYIYSPKVSYHKCLLLFVFYLHPHTHTPMYTNYTVRCNTRGTSTWQRQQRQRLTSSPIHMWIVNMC